MPGQSSPPRADDERIDALTALVVVLLAQLVRRAPARRRSGKAGRNARIVRLRAEGRPFKAIAAELRMKPEAVRAVVRRAQKAAVS